MKTAITAAVLAGALLGRATACGNSGPDEAAYKGISPEKLQQFAGEIMSGA